MRYYLCISCDLYKCVTIDEVICPECQEEIKKNPAKHSLRGRAGKNPVKEE